MHLYVQIKSGNILVDEKGVCLLADFGVSANLDKTLGKNRTVIGTSVYQTALVVGNIAQYWLKLLYLWRICRRWMLALDVGLTGWRLKCYRTMIMTKELISGRWGEHKNKHKGLVFP